MHGQIPPSPNLAQPGNCVNSMTEVSVSLGLDPFGETYYPGLVDVRCGDKQGLFVGGHWNRKRKQQTDVYVSCYCGCGQRLLCREFESHAGRQAAKSWSTSIKIADKTSANLGDWIKKQCHKLGDTVVQQKVLVWLPAKRQNKLAKIQSYNSLDREHLLVYEDGSEEILYLAVESYKLEGRPSGFAEEPSRGKHPLDGKLNDNASSTSTSKRRRLHGGKSTNDTQSMHGAASTLVGLAQTLPKDEQHASGHCGRRSGSLDRGTSAVAVEQLQQHDPLPFCWKTLFACQMSLPPSRMHEQIRSVLLDLTSVDNRLLPVYLGKCWGSSNHDPHSFIRAVYKRCQQIIVNSSAEKVEVKLLQFFKTSLKLPLLKSGS